MSPSNLVFPSVDTPNHVGGGFTRLAPQLEGMSITGLCQICESREANHSCENCGALVCEMHYDDDLHYCTDCAAGLDTGQENHPQRGQEDLPGDDVDDATYR